MNNPVNFAIWVKNFDFHYLNKKKYSQKLHGSAEYYENADIAIIS